jgi:hypothetical protein
VTSTDTAATTPANDPAAATPVDPAASAKPPDPAATPAAASTPAPAQAASAPPVAVAPAGLPAAAGTIAATPEPVAVGCARSLVTFVSSAAQTVLGGLLGVLDGLDIGSLLDGLGGPARRVPPAGPSPIPEPDHLVAPLIGAGISPAHARGGGPASGVLPTRWPLGLVLGRALLFPPAEWQPAFVPLQVERPG